MDKVYQIYKIYIPNSEDKRHYIGITKYIKRRYREHLRSTNRVGLFIRKYKNEVVCEVIKSGLTLAEALNEERILVPDDLKERTLLNLINDTGGGSMPPSHAGKKRTEEQKQKVSSSQKLNYKNNPDRAKKASERNRAMWTDEYKKEFSLNHSGEKSALYGRPGNKGLLAGEKHPRAKLTWDSIKDIRKAYAEKTMTRTQMAKHYGVDYKTIWSILRNESWIINNEKNCADVA